jgi:NADH dehydrogenase FAD-containing subunit
MKQRIVILGGGFGGLYTARELEKRLGADAGAEITLVNRDNFFLFTPMLHEVAASDLDPTNWLELPGAESRSVFFSKDSFSSRLTSLQPSAA